MCGTFYFLISETNHHRQKKLLTQIDQYIIFRLCGLLNLTMLPRIQYSRYRTSERRKKIVSLSILCALSQVQNLNRITKVFVYCDKIFHIEIFALCGLHCLLSHFTGIEYVVGWAYDRFLFNHIHFLSMLSCRPPQYKCFFEESSWSVLVGDLSLSERDCCYFICRACVCVRCSDYI